MMNLRKQVVAFVLGIIVGAVLVGTAALTVTTSSSSSGAGDQARTRARGSVPGRQSGSVSACRAVSRHQTLALNAADASLAQWQVHVGAMNKLVAGEITLAQAQAFWEQTRVGAHRLIARYRAAALAFAQLDARCPAARSGGDEPTALRACRSAVAAEGQALQAGDTAIATWRRHVRDMDMLRMGHLSPAKATMMWRRSWRTGVEQLHAYRAAARAARRSSC